MKATEANPAKAAGGNWLLIAVLTGLTAAYLLACYLPNRKQMIQLEAELKLKQQAVQSTTLAQQIGLIEQQIQHSNDYLQQRRDETGPVDAARLFGRISGIAEQAGVRTTRFEPSPAIHHDQLLQLPLAIHCQGSFQQLFDVLGGIERLPQLLWITSLRIQPGAAGDDDLHCQLNLVVFAGKPEISD